MPVDTKAVCRASAPSASQAPVRFDNSDSGLGPTMLDLNFDDGRHLINVPAG
jgi:hypothetical protein